METKQDYWRLAYIVQQHQNPPYLQSIDKTTKCIDMGHTKSAHVNNYISICLTSHNWHYFQMQ